MSQPRGQTVFNRAGYEGTDAQREELPSKAESV
jgi:hypothetical protein